MKINSFYIFIVVLVLTSCKTEINNSINPSNLDYLDSSQNDDQYLGGIKMIPISTPKGKFNVWTKRVEIIQKLKFCYCMVVPE